LFQAVVLPILSKETFTNKFFMQKQCIKISGVIDTLMYAKLNLSIESVQIVLKEEKEEKFPDTFYQSMCRCY
jgi:hypothetical protein